MPKKSIEGQHERLDRLIEINWEVYRRGDFYVHGYRKFERDKKSLEKKGKATLGDPEYINLLNRFNGKYHLYPPINPKLSYDDVYRLWKHYIDKGLDQDLPLEILFYKGNIPIWQHKTDPSRILIPKPLLYPLFYYLTLLDSILANRDVRIKGPQAIRSPFIEPPEVFSNAILLNLNLKATRETLKNAIKDILLKQGVKATDSRGMDYRKFLRQMLLFDLKKENPRLSFKNLAFAWKQFFPEKKTIDELLKILSDEYNDAVRLINPETEKRIKSKIDPDFIKSPLFDNKKKEVAYQLILKKIDKKTAKARLIYYSELEASYNKQDKRKKRKEGERDEDEMDYSKPKKFKPFDEKKELIKKYLKELTDRYLLGIDRKKIGKLLKNM